MGTTDHRSKCIIDFTVNGQNTIGVNIIPLALIQLLEKEKNIVYNN